MAAALVAAVTAIPLIASLSWAPIVHYECGPGATVATRELWTPVVLVNSPFGGFANGTGKFTTSTGWWSDSTTLANGTAGGVFALDEWSIAPSVRVLVPGPGANAVCAGFVATGVLVGSYITHTLAQNATSDAGENTTFAAADPVSDYDSVYFSNGYFEEDRSLTSCGGGPVVIGTRATGLAVFIPFSLAGSRFMASGTIDGTFNWTYSFPGHLGTWSIDDLNVGDNAPGGGWAFSFRPCA